MASLYFPGTATPSQVLAGQTFCGNVNYNAAGIMTNNGAYNITPSGSAQTIPSGYHNGSGSVAAVTVPVANVLTGTTIAGQAGTMANNGATGTTLTSQGQSYSIPSGYTTGGTVTANITNLSSGNIASGVTVGGVLGSYNPVPTPTAGTTNILLQETAENSTTSGTPVKVHEFKINYAGTYTLAFNLKEGSASSCTAYGQIYVNGVARGTLHSTISTVYTNYTDSITVNVNDLVQLYVYGTGTTNVAYYNNYQLCSGTIFNYATANS